MVVREAPSSYGVGRNGGTLREQSINCAPTVLKVMINVFKNTFWSYSNVF